MKGTFGVINGYYNIVSPISSIQVNQYIVRNILHNNRISDNVSLNTLRNIVNISNLEIDDTLIGLIKTIKKYT